MDKAKQNMLRVMERILAWCHSPVPEVKPKLNLPELEWKTLPNGDRVYKIKRKPE